MEEHKEEMSKEIEKLGKSAELMASIYEEDEELRDWANFDEKQFDEEQGEKMTQVINTKPLSAMAPATRALLAKNGVEKELSEKVLLKQDQAAAAVVAQLEAANPDLVFQAQRGEYDDICFVCVEQATYRDFGPNAFENWGLEIDLNGYYEGEDLATLGPKTQEY